MLRPYIILTDARPPDPFWPRARVRAVGAARLAVPRSARLSGAARERARPQTSRRRECGEGRAGLVRWDEAGRLVSRTQGAAGWGRTGEVRGGCSAPKQPSPPSPNLPRPSVVLRQR